MPEYDYNDDINPEESQGGSSISKALGQTALTLGLFIGGQALANKGFAVLKSKAFQSILKNSKSLAPAARSAISKGNSLTTFLARTQSPMAAPARTIERHLSSPVSSKIQDSWSGLAKHQKFQKFRQLSKSNQTQLMKTMGAKYLKETAFMYPSFYAMEQMVGHGNHETGPESVSRPAWYNLPAHAVGLAKFAPTFFGIDLLARGGFKAAGAGLGYMADKIPKYIPEPLQEAAAKTINYFVGGKHLDKSAAGIPISHHIAGLGAAKDAFMHALGTGRRRLFTETHKTLSKYQRASDTKSLVRTYGKDFSEKFDLRFRHRLKTYKQRMQQADKNSDEALKSSFDDFLYFFETSAGESVYTKTLGKSGYAASGRAMVHKKFYNENKRLPFMARLLNLRRAKGSDYSERRILGEVYDRNKTARGITGTKDKLLQERSRDDFVNNLVSRNMFIHKTNGTLVDLNKLSPKHWVSKALDSRLLTLGGKFSLANLFPFKIAAANQQNFYRVLPMEDMIALHPSTHTAHTASSPWTQTTMGNPKIHPNIYRFRKTQQTTIPGLLTRSSGDKNYNLFDYQDTDWKMVGKNLRAHLVSDSTKLANVYIKGQVGVIDPNASKEPIHTASSNPLVSWMQRNLSLFDNKGSAPSVFSRMRLMLPDSFNRVLDNTSSVPYSAHRAKNTLQELKGWMDNFNPARSEMDTASQERVASLLSRVESLSAKVSKQTFDDIISTDPYMKSVIDYLNEHKVINSLNISAKQALSDDSKLLEIAASLKNRNPNINVFSDDKAVDNILTAFRTSKRGLENRGGLESPKEKIKRFIYEYSVHHSEFNRMDETNHIVSLIQDTAKRSMVDGRLGPKGAARMEFGLFYDKMRYGLKGESPWLLQDPNAMAKFGTKEFNEMAETYVDRHTQFLHAAQEELSKSSISGPGSVLDEFTETLGFMENTWARSTRFELDDMAAATAQIRNANPWVAYPGDWKAKLGMSGSYMGKTVNDMVSWAGLGWDSSQYSTLSSMTRLMGKRTAAFAGATLAYSAADTFTDVSGLFDWTFLDEGITAGVADQMVRARMVTGWAYDKMGVDNAARYMEGLMPGSTKVIPGAAMGFMLGGIKGSIVGGMANAYLQPQLEEGPLSFMAALPPLAPFVTDLTKDFTELQDIYSGQELLPVRKGRGWSLGLTPIGGGRIERYEPGWYPRLKSQYKASPTLYGSKLEQFLAKDVPFVDFSLMDLVDPHYLEKKHYGDRPFPVASTPFSEVPVVGPILGATAGRLYNALHPMALGNQMHGEEAHSSYMKGVSYNWKGESLGTYGPQYRGFMGDNNFGFQNLPGNPLQNRKYGVMGPNAMQPLISEQIYRGWIEPLGLPGFMTSAMLWGGDEPFTHIPVAQSSGNLDSFSRTYWDQGLGDLVGSTEMLRRAIPRPRTSYEQVNPLNNMMPGWMPEDYQTGDPYCLTPETVVETYSGLVRADEVQEGTLVKTLHGRYYPVEAVQTRPVNEEIYIIKIQGLEDFPIRVTGGHPFYIDKTWKFAADLALEDKVTYPLLSIKTPDSIMLSDTEVPIDSSFSHLLGLLARWTTITDKVKFRDETPPVIRDEIKQYVELLSVLDYTPEYKIEERLNNSFTEILQTIQKAGPSLYLANKDISVIINYLKAFLVKSESSASHLAFRFHTKEAAYSMWSLLLQYKISGKINGTVLNISDLTSAELGLFLGYNIKPKIGADHDASFECTLLTTKHGPIATLRISSIEREQYDGLVYALDVGEDETFVVPGAAVHNSRIGRGELLLPGEAYESFFDPSLSFPTGASRLGHTPYDQALHMVGLGEHMLGDQENILEEGTAIHKMVQNQLLQAGLATQTEALIADAKNSIHSYVDVMYRDPSSGQELPLEIKSISGEGISKLQQPKWQHKVQLNAYMAMMGVTQGKFLYVSRDDPTMTKEFSSRFNPGLWERTLGDLGEARQMAQEFLEQGYGNAQAGYSYMDRLQVLLNSSPFSKEYRETEDLLNRQLDFGLLGPDDEQQLSKLQGYHKNIMMKYQMYPRRFNASDLLSPDTEYQNLSQNEHIRPASDYGMVERVLGSTWESFTHLRSPLHTKLIGQYSPEELYENQAIRGDFSSWLSPYEDFVKPYGRGLVAVDNPVQGALSWATGGALFGGVPGAVFGGAIGAAYGTLHGIYEQATGNNYMPKSFRERADFQDYFDRLEYMRARDLYRSTGNASWKKEMINNPYGWVETGGGQGFQTDRPYQDFTPSIGYANKHAYQAYNTINSPDRGFQSPFQGQDPERSLNYNPDINIYSGFAALAPWDRPFWTAFLDTPEEKQNRVLDMVDNQMGNMLLTAWGRGEEVAMPSMEAFFSSHYKPSMLAPIMSPLANITDYQTATVQQEGLDAHDFGMGWRDQMLRIKANPALINPLEIEETSTNQIIRDNLSEGEIADAVRKVLTRMGYEGANVLVTTAAGGQEETIVRLNVQRSSAGKIIEEYYG